MSIQTPVDAISGIPLLLVPDERILPVLYGEVPNVQPNTMAPIADWNHAYHPAKQVKAVGFGGDALRNARLQLVMRQEQHDEYHACYSGPPLPISSAERFKHVVLCAAGYIPMRAITFASGSPQEISLRLREQERLRASGEVRMASFSVVQRFMKDYVMRQPVDHIQPRTVNRFLGLDPAESVDAAREYRYMTHLLLSLVIDRVEGQLLESYLFGHNHGLLAPDAPPRPDYFVRSVLVRSSKNVKGIAKELTCKLLLCRDGPARLGQLAISNGSVRA